MISSTRLSPFPTQWTVTPSTPFHTVGTSTWLRTSVGFLEATKHIPTLTAALGADSSGAPILIDFTNTRSFPMNLYANPYYRRTLIETLINSACLVNLPDEFQFVVISNKPEDYQAVCDMGFVSQHCLGNASTHQEGMDWLLEYVELARRRGIRKNTDLFTLLVVDDFLTFNQSNPETVLAWQWLIRYGAQAGLLLVMANDPHVTQLNFDRMKNQSLIFLDAEAVRFLERVGIEPAIDHHQVQNEHFIVQTNGNWLSFNVPALSAA